MKISNRKNSLDSKYIYIFLLLAVLVAILLTFVPFQYSIILCVAAVIALLFISKTQLIILLILLLRPAIDLFARQIRVFESTNVGFNVLGLLNVAIVIFCVIYFILLRHQVPNSPFTHLLILFIAISSYSIFFAEDRISSLRGIFLLCSYLAIYTLIIATIQNFHDLNKLLSVIAYSSVIPILFGFYQLITNTGNTVISPGLNRVMGTFFHPSAFAMYLATIFPIILFKIKISTHARSKIFFTILLFSAIAMIIFSYTRIAWLGLIIALIGLIFIYRKPLLYLVFGGFGFIFFSIYSEPIIDRIKEAFIISGNQIGFSTLGSVSWRFEQWSIAYKLMSEKPLFGIGWWNFPLYNSWATTPHNEFLRIGAEAGILALSIYIVLITYMLFWFVRQYLRLPKKSLEAILAGSTIIIIFNFIVFSTTDNPLGLPEVSWYYWAIIAAAVIFIKVSKTKFIENPDSQSL